MMEKITLDAIELSVERHDRLSTTPQLEITYIWVLLITLATNPKASPSQSPIQLTPSLNVQTSTKARIVEMEVSFVPQSIEEAPMQVKVAIMCLRNKLPLTLRLDPKSTLLLTDLKPKTQLSINVGALPWLTRTKDCPSMTLLRMRSKMIMILLMTLLMILSMPVALTPTSRLLTIMN